jgi:hypothetical protein
LAGKATNFRPGRRFRHAKVTLRGRKVSLWAVKVTESGIFSPGHCQRVNLGWLFKGARLARPSRIAAPGSFRVAPLQAIR